MCIWVYACIYSLLCALIRILCGQCLSMWRYNTILPLFGIDSRWPSEAAYLKPADTYPNTRLSEQIIHKFLDHLTLSISNPSPTSSTYLIN